MTPQQAIRSVLSQYVGFSGRASRSEYWIWWGFMVVVFVAIGAVALLFDSTGYIVASVVALAFFLPNLAVTVRRLHDIGRSIERRDRGRAEQCAGSWLYRRLCLRQCDSYHRGYAHHAVITSIAALAYWFDTPQTTESIKGN